VRFGFSRPGSSLNPWAERAATVFQDWSTKGYLNDDALALSANDVPAKFVAGTGVFLLDGSWQNPNLAKAGSNLGFFVLPPATASGPWVTTASASTVWGIPTRTKNKDLAAKYIDFITGPTAVPFLIKNGDVPGASDIRGVKLPRTALGDLIASMQKVSKSNGMTPYLDAATPTMFDTLGNGMQELMATKLSPADFARRVQDDFDKNTSK
jgi:raffinose/stachyose/melibiose transport system substrate-binding protein